MFCVLYPGADAPGYNLSPLQGLYTVKGASMAPLVLPLGYNLSPLQGLYTVKGASMVPLVLPPGYNLSLLQGLYSHINSNSIFKVYVSKDNRH